MFGVILVAALSASAFSDVFLDSSVNDVSVGAPADLTYAFGNPDKPPAPEEFAPLPRWQVGSNPRTLWLRVPIHFSPELPQDHPFFIEVDEHPNIARLYREGNYDVPESATGAIFHQSQRVLNNKRILLRLNPVPGKALNYYVAIESVLPLSGYLRIFTIDGLDAADHSRDIKVSLFFGFMFAMLLFNLLMYRYRHESLYLYYAFLQPWYIIFPLWELGYGQVHFPSLAPWYQMIGVFNAAMCVLMAAVFAVKIADVRKTWPVLGTVILGLAAMGIVFTVTIPSSTSINALNSAIVLSLLLYAGLVAMRQGDRASRFWTAGITLMLSCGIFFILAEQGFLKVNLNLEGIVSILAIAAVFDAIAFTLSISERVHQESQLLMEKQSELIRRLEVERQAAEVSNIAKEQFLMNINHELQTPLTAMIGFSDMILEQVGDPQKNAAIIKKSALRLTQILKDIVDFSNTKRGTVVLSQTEFDACVALNEVLELLGPEASRRKINIQNTCEEGQSALVRADRARTRQILWNVLGNAVRFTEHGEIHVGIKADPDHVRIWVRDTGRGIEPEMQRQIFSSFTQGNSTLKRAQHGIGLGLALSRELAQIQGGDVLLIWSEVDRGSEFEVRIPTPQAASVAITETTMRASWLQS